MLPEFTDVTPCTRIIAHYQVRGENRRAYSGWVCNVASNARRDGHGNKAVI